MDARVRRAVRADLRSLAADPDARIVTWATDTISTGALRQLGHRNRSALRDALRRAARELAGDDRDE
jgi:hypothetical protein